MRSKRPNSLIFLFSFVLLISSSQTGSSSSQEPKSSLQSELGKIIVTPGSGPSLAVADFQPRSSGVAPSISTFNEVLWNDLAFASVAGMVGKSLYPTTRVADPASLRFEEWSQEPTKADYVAFGNIQSQNDELLVDAYLYDVKTRQRLLGSRYRGRMDQARLFAHQFADEIVKILTGVDGIATSKIAFRSGREIFLADYDGYNQRQFTRDGSMAMLPNLSPDGKRLAYVSFKGGSPHIEIRSTLDGALISSINLQATTSSPVFSPDGSQIAFSSSRNSNAFEIYVSDLAGSRIRRLTNNLGIIDTSPRWNPRTGREIAFISDRSGTPQIYVTDIDGVNTRRLLSNGGQADSPSWSPDGRFIAYTWKPSREANFNIYVMDVATGQIVQITNNERDNESPSWSPDGRHIAFQSSRTGRSEIWIMHIDGTGAKRITNNGGHTPSWSK